jgi:hypothetical protein
MDSAMDSKRDKIEATKGAIADTTQRPERLYDALESGRLKMDDLAPRIQQLREQQKALNAQLWELEALVASRKVQLADRATIERNLQELRELVMGSTLERRRAFIRSFVKEIMVTASGVTMTYTNPAAQLGFKSEPLVICSVSDGGRYGTIGIRQSSLMI